METLQKITENKAVKRAAWTVLNSMMALVVAILVYFAAENAVWAIVALPVAQALSQMLTKYLNS